MPESSLDLGGYQLILGSKSPRRQEILRDMYLPFSVRTADVDESFPAHLKGPEIAEYLAEKKSTAFRPGDREIIITSDTIVCAGESVLNKPADRDEAIAMLSSLSGKAHVVISGACLATSRGRSVFHESTKVIFSTLSENEIAWYVDRYQPFDKAGAYGIQEWIGLVGIERIEGSFYNVMGFPTHTFYVELKKILQS